MIHAKRETTSYIEIQYLSIRLTAKFMPVRRTLAEGGHEGRVPHSDLSRAHRFGRILEHRLDF
ncbi:MAG: hypothetical protein NTX44_08570 [Ignavibacteriales bacterium]|nr:hypothetical protein [Ignavibacteriales bacterium]